MYPSDKDDPYENLLKPKTFLGLAWKDGEKHMYPSEKGAIPKDMLKGTTALGLAWDDGVILAADRRISAGTFMAGSLQKVYMITPKIGLCMAGLVSDAQSLVELMQAELKIFALENEFEPTVKVASHLLAVVLHGSYKRYMPYWKKK